MKLLKILLATIGLGILVLIVFGLIGPEMQIKTGTQIEKPVEIVYKEFMNPINMHEWMSSYKSMEHIDGEMGEVGAVYKLIFEENGERMEMIETCTEVEQNSVYAFDFTNDVMDGNVRIVMEEVETGTEMKTITKYTGKGFMFKALLPLFKGSMKKHMVADYNKFKELVESK